MSGFTHNLRMSGALAVVVSAGGLVAADTLLVPGDFATIQEAIAAAADGDTVRVAPGVYGEQIDFLGKSIVVESVGGASATVIDGGGAGGWVVTMNGGLPREAALRGFTVTGGLGQSGSNGFGGGGLLVSGSSPTIESCVFADNRGVLGGGVRVTGGGSPLLRGNSFLDNAALQGGGLYAEYGSLTLEDSLFEGNSVNGFGGALAILGVSDARVVDTGFRGNEATNAGFGGAVYVNASGIEFSRLTFENNGKAEVVPGSFNSFVISTGGGGAVYTTNTSGIIHASRFDNNIAAFGTGLYIAGSGSLQVVNSLFTRNGSFCDCGTGVIYTNTSAPSLSNLTLADNGGFIGVYNYNGSYTVANSILAGQANPIGGNYGSTRLENSIFENALFRVELGSGNIQAAPMLDASYAPLTGSPAIDAGNNDLVPAGVLTDLLGGPRFVDDPDTADTGVGSGPIVDIGAIEFNPSGAIACPGDMNRDGIMDLTDLMMFIEAFRGGAMAADMNGDGMLDLRDVMAFVSASHNGCGI
jgi:hypothetical protein